MVIKGSAAKRDGERLHPAADVEQEGKKEKGGTERKGWDGVCGGRGRGKKEKEKKDRRERARGKTGGQREISKV